MNKRNILLIMMVPVMALVAVGMGCTQSRAEVCAGVVTVNDSIVPDADDGSDFVCILSETPPEFPYGDKAVDNYLKNNLRLPQSVKEGRVSGTCVVECVVDTAGRLDNVVIARPLEAECDSEVLRVVRAMPQWKPGMRNNPERRRMEPVRVKMFVPISFKLEQ